MPTSTSELRASLERHNETFESLLKLIPARYYLLQEQSEEQASTAGLRVWVSNLPTPVSGIDRLQIPEA